uniref:Uncharacterized protein n=1 Tax=Meloidogyne enterolobii TaxID=390850 RepID=A0A6V7V9N5_MELEN|nr:unnamed protein product [Meloidogyne enterolobii]
MEGNIEVLDFEMVNLSGVLIGIQREIDRIKDVISNVVFVITCLVLGVGSALLIIYFQSIINFVIAMYLWLNLIGLCIILIRIIFEVVKVIVRAVKNLFHKLIELLRGSG